MKRFLSLTFAAVLGAVALSRAAGPDDTYVSIYTLIQEADQANTAGQTALAREKYLQAQKDLKKLQSSHPSWNEKVVQFRLNYIEQKLGASAPAAAPAASGAPALEKGSSQAPARPADDPRDTQIRALTAQMETLTGEKAVLEAKLKEALAAQPAAVDPRELAKAEEKIRELEKDREVLRVSLEQEKARPAPPPDTSATDKLKENLAEANRKLAAQTEAAAVLMKEKEILENRLKTIGDDAVQARVLREENEKLRKQILEGIEARAVQKNQPAPAAAPSNAEAEANRKLIASLQENLRKADSEKAALEQSRNDLMRRLSSTTPADSTSDQLKKVTAERDELQKKLNSAPKSRGLFGRSSREEAQLQNQLALMRARVEALEARKVPYTPEELALFKAPPVVMAKAEESKAPATASAKADDSKPAAPKPRKEPPRGAAPLLAEAERNFAARRFDEAEKKYQEALKLDSKNVIMLYNLAATQLEQNNFNAAETTLKSALEADPSDAQCLSLLGILRFRQQNYDEALDLLSRSAQLDAKNPETQNYLGITLSQKGQRVPAETALRKAIQLSPNYPGAHHNLAVIYATQQPPFAELAKYHYQKALAGGHPQNAELERLIEKAQAARATN